MISRRIFFCFLFVQCLIISISAASTIPDCNPSVTPLSDELLFQKALEYSEFVKNNLMQFKNLIKEKASSMNDDNFFIVLNSMLDFPSSLMDRFYDLSLELILPEDPSNDNLPELANLFVTLIKRDYDLSNPPIAKDDRSIEAENSRVIQISNHYSPVIKINDNKKIKINIFLSNKLINALKQSRHPNFLESIVEEFSKSEITYSDTNGGLRKLKNAPSLIVFSTVQTGERIIGYKVESGDIYFGVYQKDHDRYEKFIGPVSAYINDYQRSNSQRDDTIMTRYMNYKKDKYGNWALD